MTSSPESPVSGTAFALHRATVLIDQIADRYLLREHGIHFSAFEVLLMTRVLGEASQTAIAENLAVSRASITQRVTALAARGLLDVKPAEADARAHTVRLSPEGSALFEAAWHGLEERREGLDEGVDEAALVAQLDRLIANALRILADS